MLNPATPTVVQSIDPDRVYVVGPALGLSDYILFGVFALCLLLLISQPVFGVTLSVTILKHLPLIFFLPAIAFHLAGRSIFEPSSFYHAGLLSWLWPFLVLGLYAIVGSLLAIFVFHEKQTYLTLGLYLLAMPLFFFWGRGPNSAIKIIKPLVILWGISAIVSLIGALARVEHGSFLHEIEFWVLSFFVYTYFASNSLAGKVASLILLTAASILTLKLTGYVIGIGAITYIILEKVYGAFSPRGRILFLAQCAVVLITVIGLLLLAPIPFHDYLPSGSARVRLHLYELALRSILDSPIWGKAYTGTSGEPYMEYALGYSIKYILPTHSDLLDLVKQGGVIALLLWALGIFRAIRLFVHSGLQRSASSAFFHSMAFMTIAVLFSMAFNPLILKPPFAFVICGMLTLTIAMATDDRKGKIGGA